MADKANFTHVAVSEEINFYTFSIPRVTDDESLRHGSIYTCVYSQYYGPNLTLQPGNLPNLAFDRLGNMIPSIIFLSQWP